MNDGFTTHSASIHIYVGNYLPRVVDYVFQTSENTPLALEYNVPISSFSFNVIDEPTGGVLAVDQSIVNTSCISAEGTNMVVYTPDEGYTGTDNFVIEYCSDAGPCQILNVSVNVVSGDEQCGCVGPDCVWPGDTNHDGVVNVADLLPIGLHYGESGASRDNNDWGAQSSEEWVLVQVDGSNTNHIDANGDGIISVADTSSIIENYGNQDNFIADPTILDKNIPIRFEVNNPNPVSGDLLSIDIVVGSEEYPVIDLHGLAMTIPIPNSLLSDSTTLVFVPNREWFGSNSPIIPISINTNDGLIHFSVTRTAEVGISGSGQIGTLQTTVSIDIDELETDDILPVKIRAPKSFMIDGRGIPVQINGAE